ncbi:hypothetical protein AB1Y20_010144 [Prymnesium parvum]|uniref:Ribosome biogenesis protein NOP53 n=1 Tax=Prymnesium parvum TaxID=97485 RepID=A0AB34K740_PRYPA
MGSLLSCLCCRRAKKPPDTRKKEDAVVHDIEGGAELDEVWDEWDLDQSVQLSCAAASEPPAEPAPAEVDPFADLGMAPVVRKTVRHNAVSVWEERRNPISSRFAMSEEEATPLMDAGGGWADDLNDAGLAELSGEARRKAAEEKRQQRRLERGHAGLTESRKPQKLAATRTGD